MRYLWRVRCWWHALYYGQWGEIYGGHQVDEVQRINATGAIYHEVVCGDCGMTFGFTR